MFPLELRVNWNPRSVVSQVEDPSGKNVDWFDFAFGFLLFGESKTMNNRIACVVLTDPNRRRDPYRMMSLYFPIESLWVAEEGSGTSARYEDVMVNMIYCAIFGSWSPNRVILDEIADMSQYEKLLQTCLMENLFFCIVWKMVRVSMPEYL